MISLSTIIDADEYFAKKLFTKAWFASDSNKKQLGLNDATMVINRFAYKGYKTLDTQENEWPRNNLYMNGLLLNKDVTPNDILYAQYEIAHAFLKGIDPESEIRSMRITSRGYSSVRTTYDSSRIPEYLQLGIPSAVAWSYLSPYFERNETGTVRIHRVS